MSHRLFICCCKGFFRDENSDELYELLDLERSATPIEIKRAYRSKSLQMHPDKLNQRGLEVTESHRAAFQKMKGAYDVLYDPSKRELYDQLGETGMLMMEDPLAAKDNMVKNFLRMSTRDRLRLVIFVFIFVGAVLLWPILFCAKVDGDTSATWVALWTPLWLYNALGLWYFGYMVSLGKIKAPEGMEDAWTDPYPLPLRLLDLLKWILVILFQIFLTLRLDDSISWSYAKVGSPLLIWMGLRLLVHFYEATLPVPKEKNGEFMLDEEEGEIPSDSEERDQAVAKRSEARMAFVKDCIWMLQLVFLAVKLDDEVNWNWWVVFLPMWIFLFGQLMTYGFDYWLALKLGAGTEGKELDELTQEDVVKKAAATQLMVNAIVSCCCWSCSFVTIILAVSAIAGADYSTFVIFIPQFIICGMVLCCVTCFICCARDLEDFEKDDETDPEQGQATGVTAPHHSQPSYGTYNPPAMSGSGGASEDNSSSPPIAGGAVIALPPLPTDDSVATQEPVQATTQAPENQVDGDID